MTRAGKSLGVIGSLTLSLLVLPLLGGSAAAQQSADDAARARCFAQVGKQFPRGGEEGQRQREMAYRACAQKAGVRP